MFGNPRGSLPGADRWFRVGGSPEQTAADPFFRAFYRAFTEDMKRTLIGIVYSVSMSGNASSGCALPNYGAPHKEQAVKSQHLLFPSRGRDIYIFLNKGPKSPGTGTGPLKGTACAEDNMKRGIAILLSLGVLVTAAYFTVSKWAIRHETLTFYDATRDNRPVAVDIAVRRDKEMQANAGMITLPVAILNHGNTVKFTEYSFLANVFAARGYLVVSIQHDLPSDPPMVTKVGELYVGRLPQYQRDIANIKFAIEEMQKVQANADYDHLTMVGHSMGADVSLYFAKMYPDHIKKVVTLDNLRVPFMTDGRFKILSFRSKDPVFKPDPGVIPSDDVCEKAGITVVRTGFQHNDMRDTGPDEAKASIQGMLDKFLDDESPLKPVETNKPVLTDAGPVAPYAPVTATQN
jgi:pimeloyl-ACP methyl ester carboxylesterase